MAGSATPIEMANTILDGKLEEYLRQWRDEGIGVRAMSDKLKRMNVGASRETVRRWCQFYGIELNRPKASA